MSARHEHEETVFFRSLDQLERFEEQDRLSPGAVEVVAANGPADSPTEPASAREFQDGADQAPEDFSRRGFLGMLAASAALAGLAGCRKPFQKILPYTKKPEDLIPGVPRWYASAHLSGGYGYGILVKSHEGRPTKVEGNLTHPGSLGATDLHAQAELLNLYDPARSKAARSKQDAAPDHGHQDGGGHGGAVDPAALHEKHATARAVDYEHWASDHFKNLAQKQGAGLAFLLEPSSSPTLQAMIARCRTLLPAATWHFWSPLHRDEVLAGSRLAFPGGDALEAHYDFTAANVVMSFDADFLCEEPASVRWARDWATRRKVTDVAEAKNVARLYVAEAGYSLTGAMADHRFRTPGRQVLTAVKALAAALGVAADDSTLGKALAAHKQHTFTTRGKDWIAAVARDLKANPGMSIVLAGPRQPAVVHALVHAINAKLGNLGKTIRLGKTPAGLDQPQVDSITALSAAIDQGKVDTLVIAGVNPVYTAPADLKFAEKLAKVPHTVHLGLHFDETAVHAQWHVPMQHPLESWGDVRSFDGTAMVVQPLIAPLYGGSLSTLELLARIANPKSELADVKRDGYQLVREFWSARGGNDVEAAWARGLHDGVIDTAVVAPVNPPAVDENGIAAALGKQADAPAPTRDALDVQFQRDATMLDGRYFNNAWLQELPDPMTKLVWDNAALLSRKTAEGLGLANGDVVQLTLNGRTLDIAVWILPGHTENCITLPLGYGRKLTPEHAVANHPDAGGFDTYQLRTLGSQWLAGGARVAKTGRHYQLVVTQDHGTIEGRNHVRSNSVAGFEHNPGFAPAQSPLARAAAVKNASAQAAAAPGHGEPGHAAHPPGPPQSEAALLTSLWQERDYSKGLQWGMVVDLNSCIGCNACVVGCIAENNIAVVGKDQVRRGREMHWLRIDRYFAGKASQDGVALDEDPQTMMQPLPCQHCENAPCEAVCPVAATTHSPEGLNDMAYNRCIGTRYCSNNCPFKVRHFNFFLYTGHYTETEKMARNPDVTVRSRGVMEKCTYCVQRIQGAKIRARNDWRKGSRPSADLRDGEFTTACAQVCPTRAITFGNINDPASKVSKLRGSQLNYAMLSELNVKPRTTYLARIRNVNPELAES